MFAISPAQQAAVRKYWVYFTDKGADLRGESMLAKGSAAYSLAQSNLAERALARRAKMLPADQLVDEADLPLHQPYVEAVEQTGGILVHEVCWLNAASFYLTDQQVGELRTLTFVTRVVPVAAMRRKLPESPSEPTFTVFRKTSLLEYGPSFNQSQMINVPQLHDAGVYGTGVLVGMLDTGFRWRSHEALSTRRVVAEHDFIFNDGITENEANDRADQDYHGTLTFSVLGGYQPGRLIGPAFDAEFILSKTEDIRSETQIEEDNWATAMIWMEAQGVEVVSSSLGYNTFDNGGGYSWNNGDFNGRTSVTALAAARAARLGVIVCTAMGNEGNGDGTIGTMLTPADADSILSIGAVNFSRSLAGFSSTGPTNDGRTKPDVVAPGVNVYHASVPGPNTYGYQQGTSLATPLVAGAAALLLSARPELTPVQVRDALRATADTIDVGRTPEFPNDSTGWGVVDALEAALSFGPIFSNQPVAAVVDSMSVVSTIILSRFGILPAGVTLRFVAGNDTTLTSATMTLDSSMFFNTSGRYLATIPTLPVGTLVQFFIVAQDSAGNFYESPAPIRTTRWQLRYGIPGVGQPPELPKGYTLGQNFPNPFPQPANPATTIRYDIPRREQVRLDVYNVLGQLVVILVDQMEDAGNKTVSFDAASLPSGVYFYRLATPSVTLVRKLVLVR